MKNLRLFGILVLCFLGGMFEVNAKEITTDYTLEEDLKEQLVVRGENVVLNMNGHKIVASANGAVYALGGVKLTITGNGTIESTNNNGVVVSGGSHVILENGTINSVEFGVLVTGKSTFTMNGGVINTIDNCGVGGNGQNNDLYRDYTINIHGGTINGHIKSSGYASCGIYHPNRGTVNMDGGVINSSNGAGIVQRAGLLNVTGGTINAKGTGKGMVGDSRVVVSASAIVVDKEANYPQIATLDTKISNIVKLNGDAGAIEVIGSDEKIELTGGVYSDEPDDELIPDGFSAYQVLVGDNENKYVIVKEDELVAETVSGLEDKENLSSEDVALIEKVINGNYNLASFYEVNLVVVTPDGDIVDYVEETEEAVLVKFSLPSELPQLETGYTRKYYIIRVHNNEVTVIDDVTLNDDGTVSFKSDRFSTYALAYKDIENTKEEVVNAPNTGDGALKYIILIIISFVGLLLTFKKIKKFN